MGSTTPLKLTDSLQTVVWSGTAEPFGETDTQGSAAVMNLRFLGQYKDGENSLVYNNARTFDQSLARFAQPDPIGLAGGINPYAYVGNNPIQLVDPTGEGPLTAVAVCGGITVWNYVSTVAELNRLATELSNINREIRELEAECPPTEQPTKEDLEKQLRIQELRTEATRLANQRIPVLAKSGAILTVTLTICPVINRLPGP